MHDVARGLSASLRQDTPIRLDAHIECGAGELLALVGPSGSGKSTLLRAIAGLHRGCSGFVRCDGATWFDSDAGIRLPPQRRRVGFVIQHYALFPHLSAQDNVACALGHLAPAARAAAARALLARVHLHGLETRRPAALSGGQQQRVAVARALARDPAVLLLDEPFSAVDQVTRRKLHVELARLREHLAIPIVLVTHDLAEARALADRVTVLHHGRTLQSAAPATLMTRPRDAAVARLVEIYNLFEGQVASVDQAGGAQLAWGDQRLEVARSAGFAAGERVCWAIPAEYVILHRRDRPSRGERENPVEGRIAELLPMGEMTRISVHTEKADGRPLVFSVPGHVVKRNELAVGGACRVTLLAEGIHLMPWEPLERAGE